MTLIKLSRLNGQSFMLNAFYIETVESFPDTTITLTNGKKFVVKEKEAEVVKCVQQFYQTVGMIKAHSMWEEIGEDE